MDPLSNDSAETKAAPDVWIVPLVYISHVRCYLHFAKQLARHGVSKAWSDTDGVDDDEENRTRASHEEDKWARAIDEQTEIRRHSQTGVRDRLELDLMESMMMMRIGPGRVMRRINGPGLSMNRQRFEDILKRELEIGQSKPTCVISDYSCPGVHAIAVKYSVPAWVFSSFPVGCAAGVVYMSELQSKGILKLPNSALDKEAEELISLPGMPLMRINELDTLFTFPTSLLHRIGKHIGPTLLQAEVVLFSTFQELEPKAFMEFKKLRKIAASKENREAGEVYTVGPTLDRPSEGLFGASAKNGYEEKERDPSLKFLDSQAESSVLFVAFGCNWNLLPEQMQEIALGLESSGQPFLVSFHPPIKTAKYQTDNIFDVIPQDCVEGTKGRGLFVQGWVPQVQILSHSAVGGFLSHCGHSSYLESVYMGVPLITWPIFCEQYMNARYIVDEIQVGVEIPRSLATSDLVDRKEVEAKVRALFQSEQGNTARKNMLRYRELAVRTVSENGSTFNNMKMIIARIRDLAAGTHSHL
ncbi:hypothetical protein R1sor_015537 [Riccia sorocarpa]|uniref:Glycosyltransferase n=1 Tax=Riccia sorocarpa TaxID=122646 RepID=A0ABD3HCX4_9MARC